MARRALEVVTSALAIVACLLFTLGLKDAPRSVLEAVPAPALPDTQTLRDATLEVVVVARSGAPVRDASVSVFWEREGVHYFAGSAVTDGAGRALVAELLRGSSWLLVSAPGFTRASQRLTLEGGIARQRVTLEPEATLVVRVTDEQGVPLARATLLVTADDPLPFGALTGNDGRATIRRLPPSPWSVKASAPGYESIERVGVTRELTLALRRLGSIRVRVEHGDGRPAPGATVTIAGSSLWPARRVAADQRGATRIAGLLAGSYDLQATLAGEISQPTVGLALERGQELETILVLEPGRSVTALVTDGEGESPIVVPDADVVLTPSGLASFPLRGRTGSDGKVTLGPVAKGPLTLGAHAEGFVSGALVAVPEVTTEPVRVALLRGATLHGDVVDGQGYPVDGASIEVIGTDSFGLPIAQTPFLSAFRDTHFDWALGGPLALVPAGELGVMPGPVPPIPAAGVRIEAGSDLFALPSDAPRVEIDPWVTRADGSFTARPVTPGRVRALARHPDYVEGTSEAVVLGPGGEARVKIVLRQGGTLAGRVLDDRGIPVAGADVEAASTSTSLVRFAITKEDGTFEIPTLPDEVVVSVSRPGAARVALRETLAIPEGKRTEIELALPAFRGVVRALVEDGDRNPVELAQVTFLSLDPAVPLRETVFTDSAGSAELDDAAGLPLRVVVEAPGFPRRALVVEHAPETLRVELSPGVVVEGRVTAVRGRQGVEGALVGLLSDGVRRSARTDPDGRYRIADIAPGRVHLSVTHPEYAEVELDVAVEATGRSDRPFELEPVDLEEPGSVEGEVVDARGDPVSGARVSVGLAPAYLPAGALPHGVAVTDGAGHFTLTGVRPGRRALEAFSAIAGRGRVTAVEVSAGRVTDRVRIELSPTEGDDVLDEGGIAVTLGERGSGASAEVVIVSVAESSEAERAGLAKGDVLVGIDGAPVTGMQKARKRLAGRPGTDVLLEVERLGSRLSLRVGRESLRR